MLRDYPTANTLDFACTTLDPHKLSLGATSWIIDIGASSHMCYNPSLMQNLVNLIIPTKVHLPDSSTKLITQHGSVNKLILHSSISLTFHKSHCTLQDLKSKQIIAVAAVKGNIYILDSHSFDKDVINRFLHDYTTDISCTAFRSVAHTSLLWHQRLDIVHLLFLLTFLI